MCVVCYIITSSLNQHVSSQQRWNIPNLDDGKVINKALEELLDGETKWGRNWIQAKYPALKYYKLGAIRSDNGAASQYVGHGGRLHSDYHGSCNIRPPAERPVPFMVVALDRFSSRSIQVLVKTGAKSS